MWENADNPLPIDIKDFLCERLISFALAFFSL
jgi:hypothetical protein